MPNQIKIQVDSRYADLGIQHIVFAQITEVNNHVVSNAMLEQQAAKAQEKALQIDLLAPNDILQGYREMITKQGRSLKKFPPSAQALIKIIQSTHKFPRINPVVDLYNIAAIDSMLSIGAHDLGKIKGSIQFRFSEGGEHFIAIGGSEKQTTKNDYVYADERNILAWLDTRDSELLKITTNTSDIILIIQGNSNTSLDYRKNVLEQVCKQITKIYGGKYAIDYTACP